MERGLALQLSSDASGSLRQKFCIDRPTKTLESASSELLHDVEQARGEENCESESVDSWFHPYAQNMDNEGERASLPVILLDAKRLTGYLPADDKQANAMVHSLRTILFGEFGSLYREDRLLDMFASKKARHGVACGKRSDFLEIPYPDFLRSSLLTRSVWKVLLAKHDIPVVDLIFQHLASCHQPLLWKHDMKIEILRIVDQETSFRELQSWKRRRSTELEQLYMVRETIAHRAEIEQALQQRLLKDRDLSMVERMKDRSGLISFDLHSTVFSFPDSDNQIMGFTTNDDEFYFGKTEEKSDGDENWGQQRRGDDWLAVNERTHNEQLREATMVELAVQDECTSTALRVSTAKASALKKKLEEVDLLLESLQDEEWAEAEGDDPHQPEYPDPRESVLTPILAMILGSSELSHQPLLMEHASIVEQWESYFGRLPPLPKRRSNEQEARERLGLVENDAESWDDQSLDSEVELSNDDLSRSLESDTDPLNDESSRCD